MIQPEFKPLIDILGGKLFSIPEYQRHYSWTKKQRIDLFRDILKLQKARETFDDRVHFMATIVCLKTSNKQQVGSNSFFIYEVVDGQQRLTTLILLLKAISKRLEQEKEVDEVKELNKLLVKDDGRLIILQNNHDNRQLLRDYLLNGNKPSSDDLKTQADKNLLNAINDCEKFINSGQLNSIQVLSILKNYLYFIFQSLEDKGAVYTIFEVLNSRGLAVDWLDKCKSMLMGLLYENSHSLETDVFDEQLKALHSYWSNIYSEIGLQPILGQEIIRFAATLKDSSNKSKPMSAEDAIEFFRNNCTSVSGQSSVLKRIEENTIWIKKVTEALSSLNKDFRRNAVTEITQARLLAVSIMLNKRFSEQEKEQLLEQWERTTFRIYGLLDKDSRNKVGEYVRTAKSIYHSSDTSSSHFIKLIANIGEDFPIDDCIDEIRHKDAYNGWTKKLRYFFYRYEEYLAAKKGVQIDDKEWSLIWNSNLNDTIEHILPQDISKYCWKNSYSEDDHVKNLHLIGNLCLLSHPLNSKAKNECFSTKKEIYETVNLLSVKELLENKDENENWTKNDIHNRIEVLSEFIQTQWSDL